jgi:hypothetical protein
MRKQQLPEPLKRKNKGQSLVELTLVLMLLLTLLVGMVEFGNLLNQYITVVDAAREGARFGSNDDPFIREYNAVTCPVPFCVRADFFLKIDQIVEGSLLADGVTRNPKSKGALSPIILKPELGDDVVISFFSINNGVPTRFPKDLSYTHGWSYYRSKGFAGRDSAFSDSDLANHLDSSAPNTGMVVVEIFYNYEQLLKLGSIIGFSGTIPVHAYSIMPLSAAEPTPVP